MMGIVEPEKIQMIVRIGRSRAPYYSYRRELNDFFGHLKAVTWRTPARSRCLDGPGSTAFLPPPCVALDEPVGVGVGDALTSSSFFFTHSAGRLQPVLPRFSSSCSGVRAPMTGAVTPGFERSQFSAAWAGVFPSSRELPP